MSKSDIFYSNVGHYMLGSNDGNYKIFFLGAIKLKNDFWKLRFSFERTYRNTGGRTSGVILESAEGWAYGLGYASSDVIEFNIAKEEFIYFANYLGRVESKEVKVGRLSKETRIEKTFKEIEKIEIVNVTQFEIQCIYHYKD